jgi:hypothetical protein
MDNSSNLAQRVVTQRVKAFQSMRQNLIIDEFILKHGRAFERIAIGVDRATPKECFANAARLMMGNEFFLYTEGYACSYDFSYPIMHAWIMYNDEVIDNTLENPSNYAYFGICFDRKFVLAQLIKHKVFGILGGIPEQIFELIQHTDPSIWKPKNHGSI